MDWLAVLLAALGMGALGFVMTLVALHLMGEKVIDDYWKRR